MKVNMIDTEKSYKNNILKCELCTFVNDVKQEISYFISCKN